MTEPALLSLESIARICDPSRERFAKPFLVGTKLVATSGQILIARDRREEDHAEVIGELSPADSLDRCRSIIEGASAARWIDTSVEELRDFCLLPPGEPPRLEWDPQPAHCGKCTVGGEDDRTIPCKSCHGKGEVETFCQTAGCSGHFVDCCECDGHGTHDCPDCGEARPRPSAIRRGRIDNAAVDRNLLHRLLSFFPEGTMRLGLLEKSEAPIYLDREGEFLGVLMPLRSDSIGGPVFVPASAEGRFTGGIAAG